MPYLKGKVCLVTGASRGIGRGIALQLAENGAICYITGRSLDKLKLVSSQAEDRQCSGTVIPVECDHSNDEQVEQVFQKISKEQNGLLNLLVNNAYAGVQWIVENAQKSFWDQPMNGWDIINNVGLRSHYICTVHAARMMVKQRKGLIINISSIGGLMYFQMPAYGVGKCGKDRMMKDCAIDLEKYNVACVSIWPGAVRTETISSVAEKSLAGQNEILAWIFRHGESTEFTGKCIAYLLCEHDIMKRTGQVLLSSDLASEFNITDVDGAKPVSMRSLQALSVGAGSLWLAKYIPQFLQVPRWLFMSMIPLVKTPQKKQKSKYE